jgi:hypothetical protein
MAGTAIPLCWVGDGGVSEEFEQKQHQPYKRLFPLHYWMLILIVAGVAIYLTLPERLPFRNPKIAAEPYFWPQGCDEKEYSAMDEIAKLCMSATYAIPEWRQYGWHVSTGGGKGFKGYYRVGNDAVSISLCNRGFLSQIDTCNVSNVIADVFVVAGENK